VIVCLPALNWYRAAAQINDFRIFVCHFRRKRNNKRKRKVQFRPKTKMAETIKSRHFRGRKRKRISVGLYSKLTTCCIIVRILGGFYDAQLKCSIVRRSLSLRRSGHFRQMWLQLTRPTWPAIGADITRHTGLLVAAEQEMPAAGMLY